MATHDPKPSPSSAQNPSSQARSLLALGLEEEPAGESQHYRPLRELARGGMGVVFDAHDAKLRRSVAIKVMQARHAGAEQRQRFFREAQVLGQLAHPNIVPIYDLGTDELGRPFYAMKLVGGSTLHEILQRLHAGDPHMVAKYPLHALLTVLQKVCDAIAFAHARGVLHRDLKPQNIMVGEFGEVLVMDWGLAKILPGSPLAAESGPSEWASASDSEAGVQPAGDPEAETIISTPTPAASAPAIVHSGATGFGQPADSQMTLAGTVMGTPNYMSPEQAAGLVEEVGPQSDVFSLGGLLYAVLTLHPPVQGKTREEILSKVRAGEIVPPTVHTSRRTNIALNANPSSPALRRSADAPLPHLPGGRVPEALSAVAMRALAVDRAQRYPSVTAFEADLAAYQGGFATSAEEASFGRQVWLLARRHRVAVAALVVVLLLSIGFVARLVVSERHAEQSAAEAIKAKVAAQDSAAETRRALARSQVSLAEAAYRELDSRTMITALDAVPSDLREGDWAYLRQRADNSQASFRAGENLLHIGTAAHPLQPGVFALASTERVIQLVDARTGQRRGEFKLSPRQARGRLFRSIAFSKDGRRLIVGGLMNGGVGIYDVESGNLLIEWDAPNTEYVRFSPDGSKVLHIDNPRQMTVRDPSTGQVLWRRGGVLRAEFTPDGQILAANGTALVRLEAATGNVRQTLPPLRAEVFNMVVSPDGANLFYTPWRGMVVRGVRLADGATFFERSITDGSGSWASVGLTADGQRVIGAVTDDEHKTMVRVWDTATGVQLHTLRGHYGQIEGMAVHPLSEEVVVTAPETRSWSLAGRAPAWQLPGYPGAAVFMGSDDVFAPSGVPLRLDGNGEWKDRVGTLPPGWEGAGLATSGKAASVLVERSQAPGQTGHTYLLVRPTADGLSYTPGTLQGRSGRAVSMRLSPDARLVAVKNDYRDLTIHETATGRMVWQATNLAGLWSIQDYGWATSQRLVCLGVTHPRGAAGKEERIVLLETPRGRQLHQASHPTAIDTLAILPDGQHFAEAGADKRVRIRDATTLEVRREFRAHDGAITALAAHPTQPLLASASADLRIRIWNLSDGRMMEELPPSAAAPQTLQFSPSGNRLASVDQRGKVRIWDFSHRAPGVVQTDSGTAFQAEIARPWK
ncbi:MAG: serine/threonine protein kinase [Limisphaerales bacterium]|nr:MAG: serine/threonine protein kinase [Limisphaerales bacterium]KAG0507329.1 MAG: serine/threonine protein kinase [Limisphaerales bacterium]TXT47850.1 MAG: serine/threonine protein kinase [Limisphaerales bacterium]